MSQTRFLNPATLGKPPGYTHVVEVTAPARIVYIAGQLGIDKEGKLSSDFRQQALLRSDRDDRGVHPIALSMARQLTCAARH